MIKTTTTTTTTTMNLNQRATSNNARSRRNSGQRLLVDYSKNSAKPTTDEDGFASHMCHPSRLGGQRQKQLVVQAPITTTPSVGSSNNNNNKIPDFISINKMSSADDGKSRSSTTNPTSATSEIINAKVSFPMRRTMCMVGRDSFLSVLKLHYSESDMDISKVTTPAACYEKDSGPQMMTTTMINQDTVLMMSQSDTTGVQHRDRDTGMLSKSFHAPTRSLLLLEEEEESQQRENRSSRRDTLKRTLRKSSSTRHLDTSPLSNSVHDQEQHLPIKSMSYHGGIRTSKSLDESDNTINKRSQQLRPGRRRVLPLRTRSSDSTSHRHNMNHHLRRKPAAANQKPIKKESSHDSSHMPRMENNIHIISRSNHNSNRRTMMRRQSSFVTGSRIRIL